MDGNISQKELYKANQIILIALFGIICALILLPFIMLVSVSLSNEKEIISKGYGILPRGFDLSAYRYVFKNPGAILNAYKVTAFFSTASMILSVFLMSVLAYPLAKKDLKGRQAIAFYIYFTMLFNGGLAPAYILNTRFLHLNDNILIYILPGLISPWYVFMIRTFFAGIPEAISESAMVDGAGEMYIFLRIIMPLSKPVLATVALFIFLGRWNDWYTALLYINNEKLISLQYLLQRIMQNIQMLQNTNETGVNNLISISDIPSETVRMAMAVVVAGPALFVFPFFQKYFVRGLTVGGVKG